MIRGAAHRVDVPQRVRRGDLAVRVRVVDDRREEVDRLHDRDSVGELVDAGIVAALGRDEHPRVERMRQPGDDRVEREPHAAFPAAMTQSLARLFVHGHGDIGVYDLADFGERRILRHMRPDLRAPARR